MTYSKIFFFGFIAMLLAFSSCKKEEISEVEDFIEQPPIETTAVNPLVSQMKVDGTTTDGLDLGCFSIDFPFSLVSEDGTTYTINSIDDFDTLEITEEIIDYVYPINITYTDDGTTASIEDAEALGDAFAACIPDTGWGEDLFPAFLITELNSCYQMVYPFNLVDGEGNILTANDEDELVDLVATNYDLSFQFPISLVDEDGNTLTANDDEELFELLIACDDIIDWEGPFDDCWDFSYPFEMVDQDGNIYVINNHDDLCNLVLSGVTIDYVFPLTLVNGNGEELVVNNNEELDAAWLDCEGWNDYEVSVFAFIINSDIFSYYYECYSINYPLEYINTETGETGSIEDVDAASVFLDDDDSIFFTEIVFPVTVTETATGVQITFNVSEDYYEFFYNCE